MKKCLSLLALLAFAAAGPALFAQAADEPRAESKAEEAARKAEEAARAAQGKRTYRYRAKSEKPG